MASTKGSSLGTGAAKALIAGASRRGRRISQVRYAKAFYRGLIGTGTARPPSRSEIRRIDDYAQDVLGRRDHRWWLMTYTAFRGEFLEGWLADTFFHDFVLPQVNGPFAGVSAAKTLSRRILRTDAIPDIGYRIAGHWYDADLQPSSAAALSLVASERSSSTVIKRDGSYGGADVVVVETEDLLTHLKTMSGDIVMQPFVENHAFFDRYPSAASATIRITTLRNGEAIDVPASFLRMGNRDDRVVRGRSIAVAIDPRSGALVGEAADERWAKLPTHPESGAPFAGHVIPGFSAARDLVLELHQALPHYAVIGWDVVIDRDGRPVVLEWNADFPGIKFCEAAVGPCFIKYDFQRFKDAPQRS